MKRFSSRERMGLITLAIVSLCVVGLTEWGARGCGRAPEKLDEATLRAVVLPDTTANNDGTGADSLQEKKRRKTDSLRKKGGTTRKTAAKKTGRDKNKKQSPIIPDRNRLDDRIPTKSSD